MTSNVVPQVRRKSCTGASTPVRRLVASLYAGMITDSPSGSAGVAHLAVLGKRCDDRRVGTEPSAENRVDELGIARRWEEWRLDAPDWLSMRDEGARGADQRAVGRL